MPEGDINAYINHLPVTPPRTTHVEPTQRSEQQVKVPDEQVSPIPPTREPVAAVDVKISSQGQVALRTNEQREVTQDVSTSRVSIDTPTESNQKPVDSKPVAHVLSTETRDQIEDDSAHAIEAQANTDGSTAIDILS